MSKYKVSPRLQNAIDAHNSEQELLNAIEKAPRIRIAPKNTIRIEVLAKAIDILRDKGYTMREAVNLIGEQTPIVSGNAVITRYYKYKREQALKQA